MERSEMELCCTTFFLYRKLKLVDIPSIDPCKHLDAKQAKATPPYKAAKGFACCI